MIIKDNSTSVVVLESDNHAGLGVVRSLGRMGVQVYCVDSAPYSPTTYSRYCAKRFLLNISSVGANNSVQFLKDLSARFGVPPMLLPTTDQMALFLAENADMLKQWYVFPQQPAEIMRTLSVSMDTYYLAKRCGIPSPMSYFPHSKEDVIQIGRTIKYPVFVKRKAGMTGEHKAAIVHSYKDLIAYYDLIEEGLSHATVIQEYIPGDADASWVFNGYFDKQSECLAAFTGRKVRQKSSYNGPVTLGISVWNQPLAELAKSFMIALKYRGMVDIDFRYDAREGTYKVLEVHPRIGNAFRLFVGTNGIDVIRAQYLDVTDQTPFRTFEREGRKWIAEDEDVSSSCFDFRAGTLSLKEWARSLRGITEAGYFSFEDPAPFFAMCGLRVRRRAIRSLPGRNLFARPVETPSYSVNESTERVRQIEHHNP